MKVICIKDFKSQALNYELTYGKVYDVQPKPFWGHEGSYFIMCDRGFISAYNKSLFVSLQTWREMQLGKVL
jgi:hypothetical protein